jgi:hypothetical protein
MKTYRRHNCTRHHRSHHTLANCIWPHALWITGNGCYATVSHCGRGITVQLHQTVDDARIALAAIDIGGCGGRCTDRHEVIDISPALPT